MTTCTKHDGCRATPADVLRWMRAEAIEFEEHTDPHTGEINLTALAEAAAYEFDHDEWLDDEQHPVWEWAITAAEGVSP